VNGIEAGSRP
jgi:hypothetical protein